MPIIAITASNSTKVNPLSFISHISTLKKLYNKNSTISSTKNMFVRKELSHH